MMQIAENDKTTYIVSGAIGAAGTMTWLDVITPIVGLIASILGILVACVIIYTRIRKDKREGEAHKAEMKKKYGVHK